MPKRVWQFLRKLERMTRPTGCKAVVISDNVRYRHAALHEAWRKVVADHFCLRFLPPYRPQLNPIERVWKLIRRCCLPNRCFPTWDKVVLAIGPRLRAGSGPNLTLKRLCGI